MPRGGRGEGSHHAWSDSSTNTPYGRCSESRNMARIFITVRPTDWAGRLRRPCSGTVIVHARSVERLAAVDGLIGRGASAVVGDLGDLNQTRDLANQVNELGAVDAVIHNAGVLDGPQVMPVNVVARTCSPHSSSVRDGWCTSAAAAPWRTSQPRRRGLERTTPIRLVFGQQTVRHCPRRRCCPYLARCVQQRCRPRLGAHANGRGRRPVRPSARAPDPGLAHHQRRTRGCVRSTRPSWTLIPQKPA